MQKQLKFMMMKLSDITVSQKYKKVVSDPNESDYRSLYESIKINGITSPLTLNQNHLLLDGHTRYGIAKELGIEYVPVIIKYFDDPLLEELFVIDANVSRRNLTEGQKSKLVMRYLEIEEKLAARRRSSGKKTDESGRAADKVGAKFDMSPRQIDRVRKIMREGSTDVKKQYESGKLSTNAAYQVVQRETRVLSNAPLPTGKHNVIYIDFPWKYENQKTGGSMTSAANQKYDTLTPEEIIDEFIGRTLYVCNKCSNSIDSRLIVHMRKKTKRKNTNVSCNMCGNSMILKKTQPKKDIIELMTKNAVLFMWMTVPMLDDQWVVIDALKDHGFKFKQMIFWVKIGRKGMGYWFENQVEVMVMCTRGKIDAFRSSLPNCMTLPVPGIHSEKPEEFRNLIDRATASMGKRSKIELFARGDIAKSWVGWGNEV